MWRRCCARAGRWKGAAGRRGDNRCLVGRAEWGNQPGESRKPAFPFQNLGSSGDRAQAEQRAPARRGGHGEGSGSALPHAHRAQQGRRWFHFPLGTRNWNKRGIQHTMRAAKSWASGAYRGWPENKKGQGDEEGGVVHGLGGGWRGGRHRPATPRCAKTDRVGSHAAHYGVLRGGLVHKLIRPTVKQGRMWSNEAMKGKEGVVELGCIAFGMGSAGNNTHKTRGRHGGGRSLAAAVPGAGAVLPCRRPPRPHRLLRL